MARDVGSYFEKLTRKAPGGRRLENADDRRDDGTDDRDHDRRSGSSSTSSGTTSRSGGGLTDVLKDVLGRGRTVAKKTTERVRSTRQPQPEPQPKPRTRTLPAEGVVAIEYSPRIDGDPDPGEVVWTWVPFEEDPEQGKDRPIVVIGRRGRNMVGVPLTTKRSDHEAQIAVGTGDWDPKHRQSYARIWRMLDFDDRQMRREGSVLERDQFDRVVAAVDEYYDVRLPPTTKNDPQADFDDDS